MNFYSRASCEARHDPAVAETELQKFLLTRLLRGATKMETDQKFLYQFLLTRLLRGATVLAIAVVFPRFSFLLTRLLRGATMEPTCAELIYTISTHAPLARRDTSISLSMVSTISFLLTRLLRGATPILQIWNFCKLNFYSRASCEARLGDNYSLLVWRNFYSRASCEARRSSV